MRIWLYLLIVTVLDVGCGMAPVDPRGPTAQGVTELRVDAGLLQAFDITRVTVEAAGAAQDLVLDPSGVFIGSILLPPGTQSLVARAFSGDMQVADVHGDRKPDIAVANIDGRTVSVLLGNGDGTFQAKVDYAAGNRPRSRWRT